MKKITVKTAKQQTVLELSDDICCYHYKVALTTNVTKKFKLEEVKRIECSGKEKREWIYLKNSENKLLAKFSIQYIGAQEAIQFFYNCNLRKVSRENGEPYLTFEIVLSTDQKELEDLISELEELDGFWTFAVGFFGLILLMLIQEAVFTGTGKMSDWIFPLFGLMILTIYIIPWVLIAFYREKKKEDMKIRIPRGISRILNFTGIFFACIYYLMPLTICIKIQFLYMVVVAIFYLLFYKKMYFILPEDRGQVLVPYMGVIWFGFAAGYYIYTNALNPAVVMNVRQGIVFVSALLIFITSLLAYNGWGTIWGRVAFIALLSFLCTENLPVAFDTGKFYHIEATVVEKERITSARNAANHYLYLDIDGEGTREEISQILYDDVKINDTVLICVHEGILSDYYYVHKPESDCEFLLRDG